jgi:hypothetical protein
MIHIPSKTFYSDIEEGFSKLINEYNFKAIEKEDNRRVLLSNDKCLVELLDTEDGLEIWLCNPNTLSFKYRPNLVYESLGYEIRIPWNIDKSSSKAEQYSQSSIALTQYLPKVLNGNFEWEEKYHSLEKEEKELVMLIMKLKSTNPIKQSFRQQKLTWKKEARHLL